MKTSVHAGSSATFVVRGAKSIVGRPAEVRDVDVLFAGGRVAAVGRSLQAPAGAMEVDGGGRWLLPGWIDIQLNDIEWLARGPAEPAAHARRIREVAAHQAARGVTGLILATIAAPLEEVVAYLQGMREVLHAPLSPTDFAFLGGLVEGTFMNPALSGAQNPAWVLRPGRDVLDRLLDTGAVRLVNIAPEMAPEALELIARATARGAVVGAGHAKPHAERLREAVKAGLRYIIHLGNGPTGSSLKAFHDGGMLEEALRNDAIVASIILDGWHVHPQLVRDWIARKEPSRVVLTSDAGFAMGAPQGEFEAFGIRGAMSPDGRYLSVVARTPANPLSSDAAALFGSAVGMLEVFENAVNLLSRELEGVYHRRHAALPLAEAILAASRMCSESAAGLLGLRDRGALVDGARADAVLASIEGPPGQCAVRVEAVWVG